MGGGTAVARHAADVVLSDDNFATIVFAVAEGRTIYANTKQFIRYMISSNIGEVVAIFTAALLGTPEVLTPVQLLWVNLVTDGLPATALGFNKADRSVMAHPPRRADEPIVSSWLFVRYLVIGLYVGIATTAGFVWWYVSAATGPQLSWSQLVQHHACNVSALPGDPKSCAPFEAKEPRTVAMSVLVLIEMLNALNNLSEDASLLSTPPWDNFWLLGAIATSMALHFLVLYVPFFASVFGVAAIGWHEWQMITYLSLPVIFIDEVMKFISRRLQRGRERARSRGGGNGHAQGRQRTAIPGAGTAPQAGVDFANWERRMMAGWLGQVFAPLSGGENKREL
uniref:Cation-transporting P-type ATPase C-terminal domain-containing protein n=1 Tax=Chlamydomonas euryale TaxID=1486919 RepID=A0A7R9V2G2_9CHLO